MGQGACLLPLQRYSSRMGGAKCWESSGVQEGCEARDRSYRRDTRRERHAGLDAHQGGIRNTGVRALDAASRHNVRLFLLWSDANSKAILLNAKEMTASLDGRTWWQ